MDPSGFRRIKSYVSGPSFSSLNGPWLRQGPFWLPAFAKVSQSKNGQCGPFGTSKSYILAKFHCSTPTFKASLLEKTANCGDPLTGTERCNKKGNLLASLGG